MTIYITELITGLLVIAGLLFGEREVNDSYRQFENWWSKDKSQFTGDDELKEFARVIWQASRSAIELDIDWPESNDDFWKDGEEGAYAMGYEDGRDKTVIAVMKAIRAAGIKEKNFD